MRHPHIMQKFLKSAHKGQRIAAVHIDLQPLYYSKETASAFEQTRSFAKAMRRADIPNIWVAFPAHEPEKYAERISSVAAFNKAPFLYQRESLSSIVGAQDHETVIIKTAVDGLQRDQVALATHLDTLNVDTLLVTGVLGAGCVASTVVSGIRADRWNIIAVQDCIDMTSPKEYSGYMKSISGHLPGFDRRFHMTPARTITDIVAPEAAASSFPVRLGRLLGLG